MNKKYIIIALVIILLGGGIWFLSQKSTVPNENDFTDTIIVTPTQPTAIEIPTSQATTTPTIAAMTDEKVREITVEGGEFFFTPTTLTLKKGEKVRLVFNNTGEMTHDFVVDELNIRTEVIRGGTTDTVEFTPNESGTFEYYCSVGQHRKNGMKGMLTVQ